ncbi:MAG: hypothetical protein RMN24_07085 [Anaerolineae bacterium]|nr:hypothetical protein [Anaerolineae bacterium]
MHPQVCAFAADVCYATHPTADTSRQLAVYLNGPSGIHRHRWLLRNHLFTPLEEVSQAYVDMVWNDVGSSASRKSGPIFCSTG